MSSCNRTQFASFEWDPNLQMVQITNHRKEVFYLRLGAFQKLAQAYENISETLCKITRQFRHEEDVNGDLKSLELEPVNSYSVLRLTVRKLRNQVYMSAGVYDILRDGRYHYNANQNFRIEFLNDDLMDVCRNITALSQ